MTVGEIIQKLQQFNPEMEVKFTGEIESGRQTLYCNNMYVAAVEEGEDSECVEVKVVGEEDSWL